MIFSGLDFGACVRVWSRNCDNEPCPCHHTLCSLRGGALQWRSCKQSERFNYPFHFIHICLHSQVFSQERTLEYLCFPTGSVVVRDFVVVIVFFNVFLFALCDHFMPQSLLGFL